ncbi:helix-turn-helix domain-containing GNAT family N-acetyltransferase [Hyphomicrobium sp. CS1BSMeth3]|uniref:bifunctional helix-turn-helix transcriptional regulator/GNAT family N-acetyltransferase n=1 Tax=Hyphomicrobium sp. CS1BSMeth3 TaxID=1892844 RepID=UPI00092FFE7C|nr:helix-turn-helix domain-containing GNAT family N-acetyltransferase [Hyphomicrobium sp. CS1BSMeth3]
MTQLAEAPSSGPSQDDVAAIRRFNRFYTRQLGLLAESMLASPFSLSEARVLYELAHRPEATASDLIRELGLDAGYLSRMLKKFEDQGLIRRAPAEDDARRAVIALTPEGRDAFAPLDRGSQEGVVAMLEKIAPPDRDRLVAATKTIARLLGEPAPTPEPYILRGLETGDAGWITHRHALIYAREYGWTDPQFEALVAEILKTFILNFDPKHERAWIAERDGEVVGSVFITRASPEVAQLRLLYVDPSARGLGLGRRLVDECIRFSRAKGYKTLMLWTHDILVPAVRIYQAAGFKLIKEERHNEFGHDVNGQIWELGL